MASEAEIEVAANVLGWWADGVKAREMAVRVLEAAERARWQPDQVKVTDRLDRVIFDQANSIRELLAKRDAIASLNSSLIAQNGQLLRDLGRSRDAIEAATIERCINAATKAIEEKSSVVLAIVSAFPDPDGDSAPYPRSRQASREGREMNDLIGRLYALAGIQPHLNPRAVALVREAAARIKELEAEHAEWMELCASIMSDKARLAQLEVEWLELCTQWRENVRCLTAEHDVIEAATIERCIDALKKLTGRTRGPIIEEAIGVIRALIKPTEATSAPAVPLSTST